MSPRTPARRLVALLAGFVLALVAIATRLALLQITDAEAYQELARDQRVRTIELPAPRGAIYDRDGRELAISLPARAVYADPKFVSDPAGTARRLAPLLGRSPAKLEPLLRRPARFVYLARGLDRSVGERVAALGLPGIGLLEESRRHYPAGVLAPQVLGFVGIDAEGLAGVELQHQEVLAGEPGRMTQEQDPAGRGIPQAGSSDVPPVPGDDVVLTIDRDLQFQAQRALMDAVKRNHAKGGTVLVMEPSTGEVLAMASYPWFDPNRFDGADLAAARAPAITDVYEPGSVNKVITAAAAIEENLFPLDRVFTVPDHHDVGGHVFRDSHPHPVEHMTLGDIIAFSSNVGTIQVAQEVGQTRLASYLARFGFGRRTGVDFPGESPGIVPEHDEWWSTGMGSIPIGQGIAVTPLQMASVYATIANGGVWVRPRLLRGTVDAEGAFHRAPAPATRRVIEHETARRVAEMLAYAVEVGTGKAAQIRGYWVAGKTGTARKPLENARGYSDKHVASFIGFLPASRPRLVVAAILDEPVTVYGGIAAAPLFQEVARYALARERIASAPAPPRPEAVKPTG